MASFVERLLQRFVRTFSDPADLPPELVTQQKRVGGSGLATFGGRLYNMDDYNRDLTGQSGSLVYEEMLNDPEIAAGMSRLVWPLLSAKWEIVPVDEKDGEEVEIAEFCERWIMGVGRTDPFAAKWQDTLRHALLCLGYGFSAFEKVWGVDQDGRQVYSQLAGILPKSVTEFRFLTDGTGSLEFLIQQCFTDEGWKIAEIPAEKLILLSFAKQANNPWGKAILRECYKAWYHENKLTILDGMRHERHGLGFMTFKVSDGAGDVEKNAAEALVKEARAHERQYAVIEKSQEVTIDYPSGQGTDILGSIKHLNDLKSQVLYSEFIHLGTSASGSRAVAGSKVDFMLAALQGVATLVEEVFNSQAIVPLVARNWGAREKYPRLECEDLSKLTGAAMADTLSKLAPAGQGFITPDPDIEQHIRESQQLPLIDDDTLELMRDLHKLKLEKQIDLILNPPALPPVQNGVAPATNGAVPNGQQATQQPPGKEPAPKTAVETPTKTARLSREPLPHEAYVLASETAAYLDTEPARIWQRAVEPARGAMIERVVSATASATDAELASGKINPGMKGRLTKSVAQALDRVYVKGRASILAERKRQLAKRTMAELDDEEDIEITGAQRRWVEATAGTFVTLLVGRMTAAAIKASQTARNADLPKSQERSAIREDLLGLSVPVAIADLGGAINQTYINGRNEQLGVMSSEVATAFYSAVMDVNTCGPCGALDGEEHDLGDPTFATPNPNCEGDWRCRCIDVPVFREEG